MRKSKTNIPLIIFDQRVPDRFEFQEQQAGPLTVEQDHIISQEAPPLMIEIVLQRLWQGLQKLVIALKHHLFVFFKKHLGEVKIPWFKIAILLLAAYVLLAKDMQFNVALQAPLGAIGTDRNGDGGDAQNASFQSDLAPVSAAMLHERKAKAFIKQYGPVAVSEMKKYKIPASIKMAQALVESRAGESRLALQSNNHFGIKCKSKCLGCTCRNYGDDDQYDMFRVFKTPWESWREHSELLQIDRYKKLQKFGLNYKKWATGLKNAGYATDENYDKKLISIIKKYQLYKLDKL